MGPAVAALLGISGDHAGARVSVEDGKVIVERVRQDGSEIAEATLPAVVTVSNEFGEPRYPHPPRHHAGGPQKAGRCGPPKTSVSTRRVSARAGRVVDLERLFVPVVEKNVEWIDGDNGGEKGRNLALKLREAKLI